MNWRDQAVESHYQTAVAIQHQLQAGQVAEASEGMQELIEALARSERRALRSQLVRLMVHVLKWLARPQNRSRSWVATIRGARAEIKDIQAETPSLTDEVIRQMWDSCFSLAKDQAEGEINEDITIPSLSWEEVLIKEYQR